MIRPFATVALAVGIIRSSTMVLSFSTSTPSRTPNPLVKSMAQGMGVLKPVFAIEAKLQAAILGNGVDREAVQQEINNEVQSSSSIVVIYTYGWSPFSTEATAILDATGVPYTNIELGAEWFLLNGKDSVKRVCLSERVDNGATSLPKVFINGQCIGGCAELAELVENGQFQVMTTPKPAPVVKKEFPSIFTNFFGQFE